MKVEIAKTKEWLDVERVVLHPEYKREDLFEAANDVALFKVNKKITFDEINEPACLLQQSSSVYNDELTYAG